METARFSEFKTGRLVPITVGELTDYAFCPNPLSDTWTMNQSLWPLLSEASDKLSKLDGLGAALPSPSLLLRPLQRREALTSNSLEGTFVTPKELLLFEAESSRQNEDREPRVADWMEVINYDSALQQGCRKIANGHALDRNLLCDLHQVLLAGARGRDKSPGVFRDTQVFIGADRRYIPPPPPEMATALDHWESYLAATASDLHPLIRAYVAHYQFEAIHPFKDGNGRIGRLWLSLTLYEWMKLNRPWLYMSEFFERNRRDYIDHLFAVSAGGEWDEWLEFCLLGTREQAERTIKRCDVLRQMKQDYQARAGHLGPRMNPIIESLFENPFVGVTGVQRRFDITYPTANSDIERLIAIGVLERIEKSRPKRFIAKDIFWAAYGD